MHTDTPTKHTRLQQGAAIVTALLGAAIVAVLASPVLMPRILRRHPAWFKSKFLQRNAALRRKHAGGKRSTTSLLTHVGRRSGRTYHTPLGARPYCDGFIVSLPYGTQTDWCRNVMVAGTCALAYHGEVYQLADPEIISGPQALRAWPAWQRILVRGGGTHQFLWLHKQPLTTANTTRRTTV
jgi:deazaflavin-dependent oxidoreductase (nitroreductase family)